MKYFPSPKEKYKITDKDAHQELLYVVEADDETGEYTQIDHEIIDGKTIFRMKQINRDKLFNYLYKKGNIKVEKV